MELTPREEDTLIVIKLAGGSACLKEVAENLKVKKPTALEIVRRLEVKNLVVHQKYGGVILTEKGSEIAEKLIHRRNIIKDFLVNFLTIPEDIAEEDVHRIEHFLHRKTVEKIALLLEFISKCSGGNPNFIKHFKEFEIKGECPEKCKKRIKQVQHKFS